MYHEVLAKAMQDPGRDDISACLLEAFVSSRDGRVEAERGRKSLAERLAHELAYDRALIELCRAMGIVASPEDFTSPTNERRRLESLLAGLGPLWHGFIHPDKAPATSFRVVPGSGEKDTRSCHAEREYPLVS